LNHEYLEAMMLKLDVDYPKIVFAILAIAFVLRVTWAALVPVLPLGDSVAYNALAHTLAQRGVYGWDAVSPSAYWPPGTSAVYAAFYVMFGESFGPTVILNIILSLSVIALTMWLGNMFIGKPAGSLAGFLMAIWPGEVTYVTLLASELPFTFLALVGCAVWFNSNLPNLARSVISGLAFGAATYFRSVAFLLPAVLWLSAIPKWEKWRQATMATLVATLVIGLLISPWSIRNARIFGHFVPMTTADGVNLWMGNNVKSNGLYMPLPAAVRGLNEYDQNRILMEDALLNIVEHPGVFVVRFLEKAALLHLRETIAITWNTEGIKQRFGENAIWPLKFISQVFWTLTLLFAVAGIVILVRRIGLLETLMSPPVLLWIYFTAVYSIFVVADRYHFPSHPFMSMLAAVTILAGAGRIRSLRINIKAL